MEDPRIAAERFTRDQNRTRARTVTCGLAAALVVGFYIGATGWTGLFGLILGIVAFVIGGAVALSL